MKKDEKKRRKKIKVEDKSYRKKTHTNKIKNARRTRGTQYASRARINDPQVTARRDLYLRRGTTTAVAEQAPYALLPTLIPVPPLWSEYKNRLNIKRNTNRP